MNDTLDDDDDDDDDGDDDDDDDDDGGDDDDDDGDGDGDGRYYACDSFDYDFDDDYCIIIAQIIVLEINLPRHHRNRSYPQLSTPSSSKTTSTCPAVSS